GTLTYDGPSLTRERAGALSPGRPPRCRHPALRLAAAAHRSWRAAPRQADRAAGCLPRRARRHRERRAVAALGAGSDARLPAAIGLRRCVYDVLRHRLRCPDTSHSSPDGIRTHDLFLERAEVEIFERAN